MGAYFSDGYLYITSTFWWWLGIGMFVDGLLAFIARLTGMEMTRRPFAYFAMVAIVFAGFMAWRDEHEKLLEAQAALRALSTAGAVGPSKYVCTRTIGEAAPALLVTRAEASVARCRG